ncbi:BZ3500_MvSof-1268-A1-R1_Chr1-3g02083 [Microbotryum saponariae]|uniref:BZ3500_MvSof-1268-A1-R1_Chr1-3g02083 protein n=1 Tax=Microbotryum saponariae TaxID=289078 RepID=A0A2X0KG72_9BASI|nr:BZ3500_MvSof-1268-A1-R1_Chr1-3g02083 [Microbotryum saponariae]SCZ95370.1 BZ3501_MvSof-1269-A2-R1_Chr1-3g01685 [Microbotryum saponariae]
MGVNLSTIDQADYPQGPSATQLNAGYTLGPLFAGWITSIFLMGIVVSWGVTYFTRQTKDRTWVRTLVGIAIFGDIVTALFNAASIVRHGKNQDRTNYAISLLEAPDALALLSGGLCAVAAQTFFSVRVYRLLPSAIGITTVEFINHGSTDETRGARPGTYGLLFTLAEVWLWASVAVDGLLSTMLIIRLAANRKEIGRRSSKTDQATGTSLLLLDFMRLAFECAVLTMLFATVGAILFVSTTETTNLSYAFTNALPGLYTLSLLWAVNATHRLRQEMQDIDPSAMVQLVWNLAEDDENQISRERRLAELARGEGLAVSLRRSAAPRKAVKQLGHEVNLLMIDRMTISQVSDRRSPRQPDPTLGLDDDDDEHRNHFDEVTGSTGERSEMKIRALEEEARI